MQMNLKNRKKPKTNPLFFVEKNAILTKYEVGGSI